MKIVFPSPIDPAIKPDGGVDVYLKNLMSEVHKLKQNEIFDFSLIGVGLSKSNNYYYPISDFYSLSSKELSSNAYFLKLFLKLWKVKIPKSAIIHTQRAEEILPFALFHRKTKRICTIHGAQRRNIYLKKGWFFGFVYDILEFLSLIFVHHVITVDKSTEAFYRNRFPFLRKKIVTIPNGVDINLFKLILQKEVQEYRKSIGINDNSKVILFVGRLEKEKNIPFLLDIFQEVIRDNKGTQLVIAGVGRDEMMLKRIVEDKKLINVRFLGSVPQMELPLLYNLAHVTIICSKFEASPTVVRESLACNTPILATDVGDIKDLFGEWTEVIVLQENKMDFVKELNSLIKKNKLPMISEEKRFFLSIENTTYETIAIYNEVLNK